MSGKPRATATLLLWKSSCTQGWVGLRACMDALEKHVWTFWRREKFLAPNRIRTPDRPADCLVTIPSMLFCLQSSPYFHVSNVCPSERAAGETWFGQQPFIEPVLLQVHCESTAFVEF